MKRSKGKPGLTLIETAIGVVIISIAFYALIAVLIDLAPRSVTMESVDRMTFLAQEKMEEYLARGFTSVTNEAPAVFGGIFSNYQYEVTADYVYPDDLDTPVALPTQLKNVKVKVWGEGATAVGTVELVTLVMTSEIP